MPSYCFGKTLTLYTWENGMLPNALKTKEAGPMLVGVSFSKMLSEGFMLNKCTSKFTKKNVGDFERGKKKSF